MDKSGQLKPLSKFASDEDIMHANIATLKLNNQKNGWKGVCVHQHANREKIMCGVHAIGHCYCYIHEASGGDWKIWPSAYWNKIKNSVISLMNKSVKMLSLRQHKSIILSHGKSQWIMLIHTHCEAATQWRWLCLDNLTPRSRKREDGREHRSRNISTRIWRDNQEECRGTREDYLEAELRK